MIRRVYFAVFGTTLVGLGVVTCWEYLAEFSRSSFLSSALIYLAVTRQRVTILTMLKRARRMGRFE